MKQTDKKSKSSFSSRRLVIIQDLALSVAASLLSILIVRWLTDPIREFSSLVWIWLAVALVGTLAGGYLSGLWRLELRYLNINALGTLGACVVVKEIFLIAMLLFGLVRLPARELAWLMVVVDILLTLGLMVTPRYIFTALRREERAVSHKIGRSTALVAGTGNASIQLAADAEASGRYQVVGFLTTNREKEGMVIDDRIVYFWEDTDDLYALQWRLGGIDTILFPMDWETLKRKEENAKKEKTTGPEKSPMTLVGYGFKRAFDITLSGVLLLIFSPLMALCALAIRLEDGKPVIYRQERIGKGGKAFDIYKFRSMRTDAEAGGRPALYSGDDDPRLTKVGKFLRQHHLDELPQLWNVFKGDMSFIGYRPERQFYIDQIMERNPRYKYLYQIRPGVTSYATLYNGYTDTLEKMLTRLDLDLYYLRNHSVLFDVKVLGLTFLKIVTGRRF